MQFDILIYSFELRKKEDNVSLYHNSCVVVIHLIEIVKKGMTYYLIIFFATCIYLN